MVPSLIWAALLTTGCAAVPHHHLAHFQQIGQVREINSFLHLSIPINLAEYQTLCNRFTIDLKEQAHRVLRATHLKQQLGLAHQELDRQCRSLDAFLHLARSQKRSFMAVAMTLFSLFGLGKLLDLGHQHQTDQQVHAMVQHVQSLQTQMKLVGRELQLHQRNLLDLYQSWKALATAVNEDEQGLDLLRESDTFQRHLSQLVEGLHGLQANTPPIQLLTPGTAQAVWGQLRNTTHFPNLPLSHPAQLSRFPVSSYLDQTTLYLIVHLPLLISAAPLQLYTLNTTPFPLSPLNLSLIAHIRSEPPYLATTRDGIEYTLLSPEDLKGCLSLGDTYFCEGLVRRTNRSAHCLSRLYDNNLEQVSDFCEVHLRYTPAHVSPVEHGWTFYSAEPDNVLTQCSNGTEVNHHFQGLLYVPREPNCTYRTSQFRLLGNHRPLTTLHADRVNLYPLDELRRKVPTLDLGSDLFPALQQGQTMDRLLQHTLTSGEGPPLIVPTTSQYLTYVSLGLDFLIIGIMCFGTAYNYIKRPRHPIVQD